MSIVKCQKKTIAHTIPAITSLAKALKKREPNIRKGQKNQKNTDEKKTRTNLCERIGNNMN